MDFRKGKREKEREGKTQTFLRMSKCHLDSYAHIKQTNKQRNNKCQILASGKKTVRHR